MEADRMGGGGGASEGRTDQGGSAKGRGDRRAIVDRDWHPGEGTFRSEAGRCRLRGEADPESLDGPPVGFGLDVVALGDSPAGSDPAFEKRLRKRCERSSITTRRASRHKGRGGFASAKTL